MFHINLGGKTLFCGGKHLSNVVCQDCLGDLSLLNDVLVTTSSVIQNLLWWKEDKKTPKPNWDSIQNLFFLFEQSFKNACAVIYWTYLSWNKKFLKRLHQSYDRTALQFGTKAYNICWLYYISCIKLMLVYLRYVCYFHFDCICGPWKERHLSYFIKPFVS